MAGYHGIAWFEIGTDDPAGAEKFYGDIFGWTIGAVDDDGYRMVAAGEGPGLHAGGVLDTAGELPGYAVFGVLVADVDETCRRVQAAGGSIRRAPQETAGGITFAHLLDPAGNQFEVFTMPPGRE